LKPLSVDILLLLAVLSELVCVLGILVSATTLDRLHYSGATTAIAPFLLLAAIVVEQGDHNPSWNAGFDALALFTLNSILTHSLARVLRQRSDGDVEL
jgi:multisubunit Na+/H+ antiporter MnhG subunit